ncbi:MAG: hypothetical protein RR415_08630 [Ruthenibacterium sp.]
MYLLYTNEGVCIAKSEKSLDTTKSKPIGSLFIDFYNHINALNQEGEVLSDKIDGTMLYNLERDYRETILGDFFPFDKPTIQEAFALIKQSIRDDILKDPENAFGRRCLISYTDVTTKDESTKEADFRAFPKKFAVKFIFMDDNYCEVYLCKKFEDVIALDFQKYFSKRKNIKNVRMCCYCGKIYISGKSIQRCCSKKCTNALAYEKKNPHVKQNKMPYKGIDPLIQELEARIDEPLVNLIDETKEKYEKEILGE